MRRGIKAAAGDLYSAFHEREPGKVGTIELPDLRTVIELGKVVSIVYESTKWDRGVELYEHEFATSPRLLTDPSGKVLLIAGGRISVRAEGLTG